LLSICVKTAKEIGIIKATIFPDICPGVKDDPTIRIIPKIANRIEIKFILDIFSFKKK
jgi:hypothetical protein